MAIKLNCPHCKRALRVKDELAGKRVKCSGCQKALTIPEPAHPSAEVEALAAAALSEEPPPRRQRPRQQLSIFNVLTATKRSTLPPTMRARECPARNARRIIPVPLPREDRAKGLAKGRHSRPGCGLLEGCGEGPGRRLGQRDLVQRSQQAGTDRSGSHSHCTRADALGPLPGPRPGRGGAGCCHRDSPDAGRCGSLPSKYSRMAWSWL